MLLFPQVSERRRREGGRWGCTCVAVRSGFVRGEEFGHYIVAGCFVVEDGGLGDLYAKIWGGLGRFT